MGLLRLVHRLHNGGDAGHVCSFDEPFAAMLRSKGPMRHKPRSENKGGGAAVLALALVLALPVLYMLSVGPAMWLILTADLTIPGVNLYSFYSPLWWVADNVPFGHLIDWYINLFVPTWVSEYPFANRLQFPATHS
jgi:hypothetical protein